MTNLQTRCALTPGFDLLRNRDASDASKGTSWQITYEGRMVYNMTEAELNGIYGGYTSDSGHGGIPPTDCSGIIIGTDSFGLVMGWEHDLFMAFGIERRTGGIKGLKILRYYAHDGAMTVTVDHNEFVLSYGRLNDLRARFCWNPNGDGLWWHNQDHRAGAGPCVSSSWPWEYPISSVTDVPFN